MKKLKILSWLTASAHKWCNRAELELRRLVNYPRQFPWVSRDDGTSIGEPLETQPFPPLSSWRDASPHLIRGRLTTAVLTGEINADAFVHLGYEWRGHQQVAIFQPLQLHKEVLDAVA